MNKIKILHILHAVGGVEVHLRLLLANLDPEKFDNVVIHGKNDSQSPFVNRNGKPVTSHQVSLVRNINPLQDTCALRRIITLIKTEKPNLIHGHSAKGGIFSKLAGHYFKIPVLHTPHAYSYLSAESKLKKILYLSIERFFAKLKNKILACSESERTRAIEEVGYKSENALVYNNSIEPIQQLHPLSINQTWPKNYICSVGRPSYQKNIELMIAVLHALKEEFPEIHLVLMGVGFHSPNLEKVKELIEKFRLTENITLLEWTKREDIFHIVKNSKLYISTARYEGLPYSIIESMALGKASVVTDADGNRDLITDNQNGFVIFDENIKQFTEKVCLILESPKLKVTLEADAFVKFNQNFNIENTIGKLEEIYRANALN